MCGFPLLALGLHIMMEFDKPVGKRNVDQIKWYGLGYNACQIFKEVGHFKNPILSLHRTRLTHVAAFKELNDACEVYDSATSLVAQRYAFCEVICNIKTLEGQVREGAATKSLKCIREISMGAPGRSLPSTRPS